MSAGEIFLEMTPVDKALRVAAVDAQTGLEVVFAAPANCPRHKLEELARAKLQRRRLLEVRAREKTADPLAQTLPPGTGRLV